MDSFPCSALFALEEQMHMLPQALETTRLLVVAGKTNLGKKGATIYSRLIILSQDKWQESNSHVGRLRE